MTVWTRTARSPSSTKFLTTCVACPISSSSPFVSAPSMQEFVPLYPLAYGDADAVQNDDESDYDVHLYWSPRLPASSGPKSSADYYASVYGTKIVAFHYFHNASGDTHCVPSFVTALPSRSERWNVEPDDVGRKQTKTPSPDANRLKLRSSRLRSAFFRIRRGSYKQ